MKKTLIVLLTAVVVSAVGFGEANKPAKVTKKAAKAAAKPVAPSAEAKAPEATTVPAPVPPTTSVPAAPSAPAATSTSPATGVESASVAAPSASGIIGEVELRPSWLSKTGALYTENYAELGYKFNKQTSVSYVQQFNTNLYDPGRAGLNSNVGESTLKATDGLARVKVNNIWESGAFHFSYEGRAYTPTMSEKRDAGMITIIRNYAKLKMDVTKGFNISLMEIPIVHIYNKAGVTSATSSRANPVFENRVYLIGHVDITDKLTFDLPVLFHQTRHRDFAVGAKNNAAWSYYAWIWPELDYQLSPNVVLGISYQSDNLVSSDLKNGFTFKDGLEQGITQLVVRANL